MNRIDRVEFFYASIPQVKSIGDGSQDALLVRVTSGSTVGWGECEASPLPTLAAYVAPLSHSACQPVSASVEGARLETPDDIRAVRRAILANSFDLLQSHHTASGIDIALWDILGQKRGEPVWKLLGFTHAAPKTAYASILFGDTPELTYAGARKVAEAGYRALKVGWGPYGHGGASGADKDTAHVRAAREGLGNEALLLVDAGTAFGEDVTDANLRLKTLKECRVGWLEEPFVTGALGAYKRLASKAGSRLPLAGGEGSHTPESARNMIDHAGVRYIQIDTGRIGGITPAHEVALYARKRRVKYVNHTFTTPFAWASSVHPFAGIDEFDLVEFPTEGSELAKTLNDTAFAIDGNGRVGLPDKPGIGVGVRLDVLRKFLVPVEIRVGGKVLYQSGQP